MPGTTCPTCYGPLSPYCSLCAGSPHPNVGLEALARARYAVDRAAGGTALATVDIVGLIRNT